MYSKNNLNIARIAWLARNFRDALFVIPYRDPLQQCASLLRQHLNFLEIHRRDPFAKRYMAGIGHFDFGDNLRPVDFDNWRDSQKHRDPKEMGFWLEYWRAAYRSLLEEATDGVCFLNFDAFCADPRMGLERVAHFIKLEHKQAFLAAAERLHTPPSHKIDCALLDGTVIEEAKALHSRLAALSIV
jgi:hypothetical protein